MIFEQELSDPRPDLVKKNLEQFWMNNLNGAKHGWMDENEKKKKPNSGRWNKMRPKSIISKPKRILKRGIWI